MKKPPKIIWEVWIKLSDSDITYSRGGDIVDLDRLHILNKTGIYTDYDEDEE